MPAFEVEFEVYCSCGEGLCNQSAGGTGPRGPSVTVEPCKKCIELDSDEARDEGYAEGHKEGHKDGYDEGHEEGMIEAEEEAVAAAAADAVAS